MLEFDRWNLFYHFQFNFGWISFTVTKIFVIWFIDIYLFSVVVYIIFILHLYLHSHSIRIYLFFSNIAFWQILRTFMVRNVSKIDKISNFPMINYFHIGYFWAWVTLWVLFGFDLGFGPIWTNPDIWSNQWKAVIFCSHHKSLIFRISL